MSSKPVFNQVAGYKGTDYERDVWVAAEAGMIDADEFRPAADIGLNYNHVVEAFNFLQAQKKKTEPSAVPA